MVNIKQHTQEGTIYSLCSKRNIPELVRVKASYVTQTKHKAIAEGYVIPGKRNDGIQFTKLGREE